jgi:ribonucleoside-diphosphate reductase alpha chain
MLDNVLDATVWPLPEQHKESQQKRRIGVGFTGLGDALIMLRLKYNSDEGVAQGEEIARQMRDAAYLASVELAKEKGAFPLFDADKYLKSGFTQRLPEAIRAEIRKHGIRNSHLLSIAPTGTVSLAFADNASNGIEPPFSWTYNRKKRTADGGNAHYTVEDHAYRIFKAMHGADAALPEYFVSALEMTAAEHVAMMRVVQPYIDTAISKTVNIPADYPFEDFKNLYMESWKAGLKGCATYRPNDTLGAVLSVEAPKPTEAPKPAAAATHTSNIAAVVERRPEGPLNAVVDKIEYFTHDGARRLYLVVSFMLVDGVERPIEFFMPVGQTGESQQWITATMRSLSLAARGGFLEKALEDLRKVAWDRGPIRYGWRDKEDGSRMPIWHDSEVALLAYAIQAIIANRGEAQPAPSTSAAPAPAPETTPTMSGTKCPDCGAHAVIKKDGCSFCTACGYIGACG